LYVNILQRCFKIECVHNSRLANLQNWSAFSILSKHNNYVHESNYGEHFTFCNPEMTSETCACFFYANRQNQSRKL